ncbi:MAG: hypothetical protein HRT89_13875, partial [Lentisphaeria bacterium]|nr:hypothetical protein [Lentisphaeria bacterium]
NTNNENKHKILIIHDKIDFHKAAQSLNFGFADNHAERVQIKKGETIASIIKKSGWIVINK